jgi:subtilisin family serine protease
MTETERNRIISNDYADLIIGYMENTGLLQNFQNSIADIVDDTLTILHFPVENMTPNSISRFSYQAIPLLYGLLSSDNINPCQFTRLPPLFTSDYTGKGVLIGFIDTGIDYRHPAFLTAANQTRIVSIWDQSINSGNPPGGFNYGTEYTREQINLALTDTEPYQIVPSKDEIGHGTMIAGMAAGSPSPETNFSSTSMDAELIVVKLKEAKTYLKDFFVIPRASICYQENDIIMGIKYLNEVAIRENKPLVICFGLGTNKSDHAGNRPMSRYLASISRIYGRAVVVAAGNEGNRDCHYFGSLPANLTFDDVSMQVGDGEAGFTIQFWGTSPNYFWVDLFAPNGDFLARVPPIHNNTTIIEYEDTSIVVDTILDAPYSTEQFIILRFQKPIPGIWRFYVFGAAGDLPMKFHMWLPLHQFITPETIFLRSDNNTTVTDPGNNENLICMTAFDSRNDTLYYNAGLGFTVTNYPKPDLAAPGVNMVVPFPEYQYTISTGSSLSAAYAAGVIADLFQWGITEGNLTYMNNQLIKNVLTQSAIRRPELTYPNPEWGYGILAPERIITALTRYIRF